MLYFQSVFIYVILILIMSLFSAIAGNSKHKIWFAVPVVAFSLIFGFRYGVGIDYYAYRDSYFLDLKSLMEYYELGYVYLVYISRFLNLGPEGLFVILSFLQIYFIYKAFLYVKKEALVFFSIYLIFTGIAMMSFMNNIRQTIALSIFIYAIRYIVERKALNYYLLCLLAVLFHKSAIILFFVYPLYRFHLPFVNNIKRQIVFLFIVYVSSFFVNFVSILFSLESILDIWGYGRYIYNSEKLNSLGFSIGYSLIFIQYLIAIFYSNRLKSYVNSKAFDIYYDLFYFGVILELLFSGSMILNRFAWYMIGFKIIILPVLLYYLYKTKIGVSSSCCLYMLCLLILISFIRMIVYSEENTTQFVFSFQEDLHYLKDSQFYNVFVK